MGVCYRSPVCAGKVKQDKLAYYNQIMTGTYAGAGV